MAVWTGATSCAGPRRWASPARRPALASLGGRLGRGRRSRAAGGRRRGAHQDPARRRRVELHVGQREARRDRARRVRRRPADVRRVHDSRAGPSSVPGRARARRRRSGHRLDGDARRPSGLVPVSRAGRLQGVRRRSAGHGRSPLHPDLHGGFPGQAPMLESIAGRFTPPSANPAQTPNEYQKNHTQWPGPGNVGSPDLDQLVAGQGGSYVVSRPPPARPAGRQGGGAGRQGGAPARRRAGRRARRDRRSPPTPAAGAGSPTCSTLAWRQAGADLLDKIGPAIIMTHSAGGPFGLLVAEARPNLVKATVIIEGAGSGFAGGNRWGMSSDPGHLRSAGQRSRRRSRRTWVANPEPGVAGYFLQAEPARKLPNLKNTKVRVRHRRCVVRVARQSRRRGVPEAGGRAGRGAAPGRASASRATAT